MDKETEIKGMAEFFERLSEHDTIYDAKYPGGLFLWVCVHEETEERHESTTYQLDFGAIEKRCPECNALMEWKRFYLENE